MSANPVFFVNGPEPLPAKHRLVDVPGVVIRNADPHWQLGVRVWPYPPDSPTGWDPCSVGTFRPKDEATTVSNPEFSPIGVVGVESCSTFTVHDQEEYKARAEVVFEAGYSAVIEQQLAMATYVDNPAFKDAAGAELLFGGAATAPTPALSALENAIGATHKAGIIWADPATATAWAAQYLVFEDGDGVLRTGIGTPVVVGQGLIGAHPDTKPAPADGDSWAWATNQVHVLLGERFVLPEDVKQALDRENNVITYRVEAAALPYWDDTFVAGALVEWT